MDLTKKGLNLQEERIKLDKLNAFEFPPYPTLEDPDKLVDGTTIVGFPIGLTLFMVVFIIGFCAWVAGTIRRIMYRNTYLKARKEAKA